MKDKRHLYILGSGDLARELASSVQAGELVSPIGTFEVKAFVDIDIKAKYIGGVPVLHESEIVKLDKQISFFVLGMTNPTVRKKIVSKYSDYLFPSFIHRSSSLSYQEIEVGRGNVFTANTYVSINVDLGEFNFINWNTTIGHDAILGQGNVLNPGVRISGGVKLGCFNFIGANAMILENKTVGDSNVIGACTFLNKNISNGGKWVGVPARCLSHE